MFSGRDGDLIDTVVLGERCSALVSVGVLEVSIEDYGPVQFVLKSCATVAGNASDDRFDIVIEASDPKFNPAQTRALLEQAGGKDIAEIEE